MRLVKDFLTSRVDAMIDYLIHISTVVPKVSMHSPLNPSRMEEMSDKEIADPALDHQLQCCNSNIEMRSSSLNIGTRASLPSHNFKSCFHRVIRGVQNRLAHLPILHREAALSLPYLIDVPRHLAAISATVARNQPPDGGIGLLGPNSNPEELHLNCILIRYEALSLHHQKIPCQIASDTEDATMRLAVLDRLASHPHDSPTLQPEVALQSKRTDPTSLIPNPRKPVLLDLHAASSIQDSALHQANIDMYTADSMHKIPNVTHRRITEFQTQQPLLPVHSHISSIKRSSPKPQPLMIQPPIPSILEGRGESDRNGFRTVTLPCFTSTGPSPAHDWTDPALNVASGEPCSKPSVPTVIRQATALIPSNLMQQQQHDPSPILENEVSALHDLSKTSSSVIYANEETTNRKRKGLFSFLNKGRPYP